MKREIKFRAWDGKEIYYLESLKSSHNHYLQFGSDGFWLNHSKDGRLITSTVTGGEIMQFTGLKDKNGKECYHNDLLKGFGKLWLVEWQKEEARFWLAPSVGNSMNWKFMDEVSRMEIVGNIYENPELLTQ